MSGQQEPPPDVGNRGATNARAQGDATMDHTKAIMTGKKRALATRRSVIKGLGAAAGAAAASGLLPGPRRYIQARAAAPIKIGFQCHRTGIGAAYGRWY